VREAAFKELKTLGLLAEPVLRQSLQEKQSPEVSRQVEALLDARVREPLAPERLREIRAVQALEQIGAPARPVLEALSQRAPAAGLTQEARAALTRIDARR
jgi:hypothetical protein